MCVAEERLRRPTAAMAPKRLTERDDWVAMSVGRFSEQAVGVNWKLGEKCRRALGKVILNIKDADLIRFWGKLY